jgi:putative ABC transport system permease protein
LPDHALGDRGREERVSPRDRAHGGDQLLGRVVLEHEPARSGAECLVDVFVEAEGREDQDPGVVVGADYPPGRLEAVEFRHPDVHQDDGRITKRGLGYRLTPVSCFGDHFDVLFTGEQPRLLGPGRLIGGLLALGGAVPLFMVSVTTTTPETAAATSELNAIFLVVAAAFLGPIVPYVAARLLARPLAALSPVGGFLASANLGATRRFSSASTPIVLAVALNCTLLFSSTTIDHATTQQRQAGLTGQLAITSTGPGLPAAALADTRATPGVRSAAGLTSTTLGPGLGTSDTVPAQILTGGQGGGLDAGVIAGSLSALHGDTIALGRHRAGAAHARVGDRPAIMLGDGTRTRATVVAIYTRDLAFGDALIAPELAAGHQTAPLLSMILIRSGRPAATAARLQALAQRYPGLRVSDSASLVTATDGDRELNRWLGPFFVVMIFTFTSIAILNTLIMITLRRRRELALLRLTGATARQVRSMAR